MRCATISPRLGEKAARAGQARARRARNRRREKLPALDGESASYELRRRTTPQKATAGWGEGKEMEEMSEQIKEPECKQDKSKCVRGIDWYFEDEVLVGEPHARENIDEYNYCPRCGRNLR